VAIRPELTRRFDLQDDVMYVGEATFGAADSDPVWTIKKITLVAGNPVAEMVTAEQAAVWDNRATETYG